MYIAFLIATAILVVLTALPLWRHEGWWVRIMDFPRLQLSFLAVLLMAGELIFLDLSRSVSWILPAICLLCLGYHAWWIIPYTRLFPVEVKPGLTRDDQRKIGIMTANVLMSNRNAGALLRLVRQHRPDVLVTLESDRWWEEQLAALEPDYPHSVKCPLDNRYGMHVYSRLPLTGSRIEHLVEQDIPSVHTLLNLEGGHQIRAHFLHPKPPSPTESDESAERDAELVVVARKVAESAEPVIVAGDLNDVAWSETTRLFRKISRLADPRIGRGFFNTYHAGYLFIRWPLDHIFHSTHFALAALRRLPGFGSDHFPLLTELIFQPEHNNTPAVPGADGDDQAFADSKVQQENVSKDDVPQPGNP